MEALCPRPPRPPHRLLLLHLRSSPGALRFKFPGPSGRASSPSPPPPSAAHGMSPGTDPSAATPSGPRRTWSSTCAVCSRPSSAAIWCPRPPSNRDAGTARRHQSTPRLARAAGSLSRGMGRRGHAHLRALRQLVAQRVWPRREDRQPAARAADPRHPRGLHRHAVPDPRRHEPRSRRRRRQFPHAAEALCSISAASRSAGRCSSCRSTPGTSRCTGQRLHRRRASRCRSSSPLLSQASRFRWAATTAAAVYTSSLSRDSHSSALSRTAEARAGLLTRHAPVPAKFPILIIVPAFALDLLWQRTRHWKPWQIALVSGVVFVAVLLRSSGPSPTSCCRKASETASSARSTSTTTRAPDGFDRAAAVLPSRFRPTLWRSGLFVRRSTPSISTWIGLALRPLDAEGTAMRAPSATVDYWPLCSLCCAALSRSPARAHVGTKTSSSRSAAGPYKFFVTIRPPTVIPGVATIEVRASRRRQSTRSASHPCRSPAKPPTIHPPPTRCSAPPPTRPSLPAPLWLMASGSWQVRFQVDGAAGPATASVPVPAMPLAVLRMQRPLGIILARSWAWSWCSAMAGIIYGAVRESRLAPGTDRRPARRRRAVIAAAAVTLPALVLLVCGRG